MNDKQNEMADFPLSQFVDGCVSKDDLHYAMQDKYNYEVAPFYVLERLKEEGIVKDLGEAYYMLSKLGEKAARNGYNKQRKQQYHTEYTTTHDGRRMECHSGNDERWPTYQLHREPRLHTRPTGVRRGDNQLRRRFRRSRQGVQLLHFQPGVHREVCIDKMEFNAYGTIKSVVPTDGTK